MEIIYLQKLADNPSVNGETIRGMTQQEIDQAEHDLKLQFPPVYREFLFIAGKYEYLDTMPGAATADLLDPEIYQRLLDKIKNGYVKLDGPIWAVAEMDSFEQFIFFYLNDDDDPMIYGVKNDAYDDNKGNIYPLYKTLSNYINGMVDIALKEK